MNRAESQGQRPGLLAGRRCENGKLAAGAGPVQMLSTNGSVVNDGCNFNIILGTLSSLVCSREPPGPSTAIGINDEGVIGSSRDNLGLDSWDLSGFDQNPGTSTLVLDDRIIAKGIDLQATLEAVQTAPYQTLAICSPCDGVVRATAELGDAPTGE